MPIGLGGRVVGGVRQSGLGSAARIAFEIEIRWGANGVVTRGDECTTVCTSGFADSSGDRCSLTVSLSLCVAFFLRPSPPPPPTPIEEAMPPSHLTHNPLHALGLQEFLSQHTHTGKHAQLVFSTTCSSRHLKTAVVSFSSLCIASQHVGAESADGDGGDGSPVFVKVMTSKDRWNRSGWCFETLCGKDGKRSVPVLERTSSPLREVRPTPVLAVLVPLAGWRGGSAVAAGFFPLLYRTAAVPYRCCCCCCCCFWRMTTCNLSRPPTGRKSILTGGFSSSIL